METQATPRPWVARNRAFSGTLTIIGDIEGNSFDTIAYIEDSPEVAGANAALIIRGVNNHDELVRVVEMYMDGDQCVCDNEGDGCIYDVARAVLEQIAAPAKEE